MYVHMPCKCVYVYMYYDICYTHNLCVIGFLCIVLSRYGCVCSLMSTYTPCMLARYIYIHVYIHMYMYVCPSTSRAVRHACAPVPVLVGRCGTAAATAAFAVAGPTALRPCLYIYIYRYIVLPARPRNDPAQSSSCCQPVPVTIRPARPRNDPNI